MRRRGLTILELMTVFGVVSVVGAILLPALLQAQESSRKAACSSNMRQFGAAINSYCATHKIIPPIHLPTGSSGEKFWSANTSSVHGYILPYLDASDLYDLINYDFACDETLERPLAANRTARQTRVSMFLCPSSPSGAAINNYRVNGLHIYPHNFPFRYFRPVKPSEIEDGLGNTVFVSERNGGSFSGSHQPSLDLYDPGTPGGSSLEGLRARCQLSADAEWYNESGRFWFYSGGANTGYSHHGLPNDQAPSCAVERRASAGIIGPRSFHSLGVNVLYGDGRVSFISDSVDGTVWMGAGTAYEDNRL